jgi:hypothetical protein
MTGPRLTIRTFCALLFVALCVAGVLAICWALSLGDPR